MKMKTKLLREKAVLNQYVISARVEAFHFSSLSKDYKSFRVKIIEGDLF